MAVKAIIGQKHFTKFLKPTGVECVPLKNMEMIAGLIKFIIQYAGKTRKNPRMETILILSLLFPLKVRTE